MDRRDFLTFGAGIALGTAARSDNKSNLEIVDAHTHFYDPSRPEGVPWPGRDDKVLYRPVLPDEYKKLAGPLRVVGTVVVEASPWVEDNQWLLNLAAKEPFLLGIVGNLNPAADDFDKNLHRFALDPLYRGIRISHDDLKTGFKGKLVDRCKLLIDHDLTLDVNGGPEMPADVAQLAGNLSKLRIVINHCANLKIDGKEPPRSWREGMHEAAKHPNVYCKVSALVEETGRKEPPRDVEYYKPVIDVLWKEFGEDRLVFGSNWPVSDQAAPLSTVVRIVREYFRSKGDRAAVKYFAENSKAAYACKKR
jgi:L-fuconolactonase